MPENATTNESNHVTLILRELSDDEKMKYITEMREKALHDEATAINAAEKRGEKRGMEKARAEGLAEDELHSKVMIIISSTEQNSANILV